MFDQIKAYANLIALCVTLIGLGVSHWYAYRHGEAKVQAEWDKDKAARKLEADKQAAVTAQLNKEHKDALDQTTQDLDDTHRNLGIALERLRDLPYLPRQKGLPVAGSGKTAMPGVADHPGGAGVGIGQRIGGCEDTGTDPCYVGRPIFEQAISDALDRKLTREWAAGQGIRTEGAK